MSLYVLVIAAPARAEQLFLILGTDWSLFRHVLSRDLEVVDSKAMGSPSHCGRAYVGVGVGAHGGGT